jgi:hypothetical protein
VTANVAWVEKKGDTAGIMVMSDETRIWTPDKAKADELVGKPIPDDWTQKDGQYGPQAFPPRAARGGGGGGFAAAFRNSKEGQFYEQERMDRRTALMQAVEFAAKDHEDIYSLADGFYNWLRQTSGVAVATVSDNGEATAPRLQTSQAQASPSSSEGGLGVDGEDTPGSSSAVHIHEWTPAPREGWALCICGLAEKASKVVMADA